MRKRIRKTSRRFFYRVAHAVVPAGIRRPIRGLFPRRAAPPPHERNLQDAQQKTQLRLEAQQKKARALQTKAELASLKQQKRERAE
jgi:hypothetical protein